MKAAVIVFLLSVGGLVSRAQNSAAPSSDVTIRISGDTPEYCLGEVLSPGLSAPKRGPDDITLRLPLEVRYENHRSETIIVPTWTRYLTRMTVVGQNGSTVLRSVEGGRMNVNELMALSSPDLRFSIIVG